MIKQGLSTPKHSLKRVTDEVFFPVSMIPFFSSLSPALPLPVGLNALRRVTVEENSFFPLRTEAAVSGWMAGRYADAAVRFCGGSSRVNFAGR